MSVTSNRTDRESMKFDVLIIGGGPSGLSAAIKLKQLANENQKELSVCVVEKSAEIGGHLLSGAVFEPRALDELIPNWQEKGAPLNCPVTSDKFGILTDKKFTSLPTPPQMHNKGNHIISLGQFSKWLAGEAGALGVEIYPGFAAAEILYSAKGHVIGVATGDMGIDVNGEKTAQYEPGVELHATQTLFAEGCRGSLTKRITQEFNLRKDADPQTYAIGIKEVWEIDPKLHQKGHVTHTIGWPLDNKTYGGSWIYHMENNLISIGFVVGLDYQNPYLSPFQELQRLKLHPSINPLLRGAKRLSYGARALSEGGLQSLPKLSFPGGLLIGDTAGFLNVPKIKGNHAAMKSGMLAAEAIFEHLTSAQKEKPEIYSYVKKFKESWLYKELYLARNIRPSFHRGLYFGLAYSAFDTYLLRGRAPWTFKNQADHTQLKHSKNYKPIAYPKPDGVYTFDILSSVFISNTNHAENQPVHLQLKDPSLPTKINLPYYDGPEQRYCPAGVYEYVMDENTKAKKLQINAQNCIHCKTCDIKDPEQNINWVTPNGGDGPNYTNM